MFAKCGIRNVPKSKKSILLTPGLRHLLPKCWWSYKAVRSGVPLGNPPIAQQLFNLMLNLREWIIDKDFTIVWIFYRTLKEKGK